MNSAAEFFNKNIAYIKRLLAEDETRGADEQNIALKKYGAIILCIISIVLTVLNIVKDYGLMTGATSLLAVGFAVSAWLCKRTEWIKAANIVMLFLVVITFTLFAVLGKNEGFAILWILLIPAIAPSILNLKYGLIVSLYFQVLLILLFYTPLRYYVEEYYTGTFIMRFPILYFASFMASGFVVLEMKIYQHKTIKMAHEDIMTKCANRRYYAKVVEELDADRVRYARLTAIAVDVNGLKQTNDTIGHLAGDEIIKGTADCLRTSFDDAIIIARTGGDEFVILTDEEDAVLASQMFILNEKLTAWRGKFCSRLSISMGIARADEYPDLDVYGLVNEADRKMYSQKAEFYRGLDIERGTMSDLM